MKKVIKLEGGEELPVKRFYLNDVIFNLKCPNCKTVFEFFNGDHEYLSYPVLGQPNTISGCCSNCNEEFEFPITLNAEVEYDISQLKKV